MSLFENVLYTLLPPICLVCRKKSYTPGESNLPQHPKQLCHTCYKGLPWIEHACIRCGTPLPEVLTNYADTCQDCLVSPPPFDRTYAIFTYQRPIRQLILDLKFRHQLSCAKLLGQLMAEKMATAYQKKPLPESILPVPLHYRRISQRGFNQAIELARPIAKHLQIPINYRGCKRVRHTAPQSSLTNKARHRNLRQAFKPGKATRQKHIAILDDVMTTGSTVTALAHTLRDQGADTIDIWCCARGHKNTKM